MVEVYVLAVKKDMRKFSEVSSKLKEQVRIRLIEDGYEHLIDE